MMKKGIVFVACMLVTSCFADNRRTRVQGLPTISESRLKAPSSSRLKRLFSWFSDSEPESTVSSDSGRSYSSASDEVWQEPSAIDKLESEIAVLIDHQLGSRESETAELINSRNRRDPIYMTISLGGIKKEIRDTESKLKVLNQEKQNHSNESYFSATKDLWDGPIKNEVSYLQHLKQQEKMIMQTGQGSMKILHPEPLNIFSQQIADSRDREKALKNKIKSIQREIEAIKKQDKFLSKASAAFWGFSFLRKKSR